MILVIIASAAFALCFWSYSQWHIASYFGWAAVGFGVVGLDVLLSPHPLVGALFLVFAIVLAWIWWSRWRDKRRRAARWLGEKSRAVLARLVKKMRESRIPAPVPVPC